jgi:glycosyltransferase involved in cell wall biosynthesis
MSSLMALSHSRDDPASRFRVLQYLPHFEAAGWVVSHRPNIPSRYWRPSAPVRTLRSFQRGAGVATRRLHRRRDIRDAASYDVVFLNRDMQEGEIAWEKRLFASNPHVVFDFDDAIFLGEKRRDHVAWVCGHAAWVTAGNEYLASFARQFTDRVTIVPSVVATERYQLHALCGDPMSDDVDRINGGLRVGWLGSDLSIRETLFPFWDELGRIQQALGFDVVICSRPRPTPPSNLVRWRYLEWSPTVEEEIARHIDIGIMPLVDTEFQRGKCGMKLLQYMAAGLPVITSPVGVNSSIVQHGVNGFLADGEDEWRDALAALLASPDIRRNCGLAGRRHCQSKYSLTVWVPALLEIFDGVATGRRAVQSLSA